MQQLRPSHGVALVLFFALAAQTLGDQGVSSTNPLFKTLTLLDKLKTSIEDDGAKQMEAYSEYLTWCEKQVYTGKKDVENKEKALARMQAELAEVKAQRDRAEDRVQRIREQVVEIEGKLKEQKDLFTEVETELKKETKTLEEAVETLDKAHELLSEALTKAGKEKAKTFLQESEGSEAFEKATQTVMASLTGLAAVVEAGGFSNDSRAQLIALLQSHGKLRGKDADSSSGSQPTVAAYTTRTGDLVQLVKQMQDDAESDLQKVRTKLTQETNTYKLKKQSLDGQKAQKEKDIKAELAAVTEKEEEIAERFGGNFDAKAKEIEDQKVAIKKTQGTCMEVGKDSQKSQVGRTEELSVLAKAIEIIKEASQPSFAQEDEIPVQADYSDGVFSFAQLAASISSAGSRSSELEEAYAEAKEGMQTSSSQQVLSILRRMARQQNSPMLAQLTSKVYATIKSESHSGKDPLAKVRKMLKDMVVKLNEQMAADATEKAYCDNELKRTKERIDILEDDVDEFSAKIDKMAAQSTKLKEEVVKHNEEITKLNEEQEEMLKARDDAEKARKKQKFDMQNGLDGIRKASMVLKTYYGSSFLQGAPEQKAASKGASLSQTSSKGSATSAMAESMGMDVAGQTSTSLGQEGDASDASQTETAMGITPEEKETEAAEDRAQAAFDSAEAAVKEQQDDDQAKKPTVAVAAVQEGSQAASSETSDKPDAPEAWEQSKTGGASIISFLNDLEKKFAKDLAKLDEEAEKEQAQIEGQLRDNKVNLAGKKKDIEYKTREFKNLDKEVLEVGEELANAKRELKPLKSYLEEVKKRCIKTEDRKEVIARREKEIAGLKEALTFLEGDEALIQIPGASFLQHGSKSSDRSRSLSLQSLLPR
eukprot:TRINITY_DN65607_c0_g1_i1.p1 TRINITY_DN65607_c0_g1~~TRINITY_DN65607_c0_g1_i1.p1  ORF type:complete len:879 (+),score=297.46 TRINITY_DN65607_c0_g1_i1:112-2748(+)